MSFARRIQAHTRAGANLVRVVVTGLCTLVAFAGVGCDGGWLDDVDGRRIDERLLGDWWLQSRTHDGQPFGDCARLELERERAVWDASCKDSGVAELGWEIVGGQLVIRRDGQPPDVYAYALIGGGQLQWQRYDAQGVHVVYRWAPTRDVRAAPP